MEQTISAGGGRETLDHAVRVRGEPPHRVAAGLRPEVEHRAALSALPDAVARLHPKGITAGRLDLGDQRAVVGEEHRRHGSGNAPGEVENTQTVENAWHPAQHSNY